MSFCILCNIWFPYWDSLLSSTSTVLFCTLPYCDVVYCIVMYCTILYCFVMNYFVLQCTVLYCTELNYFPFLWYSVIQFGVCAVMFFSVLHCYLSLMFCAVLLHAVLHTGLMNFLPTFSFPPFFFRFFRPKDPKGKFSIWVSVEWREMISHRAERSI